MKPSRPIQSAPWATRIPATKPDPVAAHVRALVRSRAHSTCELCGTAVGTHVHHRQLRRFGNHTPTNLVLLCGTCHTRVHGHPDWARSQGWLLKSHDDPAMTSVAVHGVRWVLLMPDGTYRTEAA